MANQMMQVIQKLDHIRSELDFVKEVIITSRSELNKGDKKALDMALKEEKKGRLLSKKQVFG